MKHVLLAVSGPSGVGKGTMVKTLIARREDVVESVSCTTRAPREGEVHGKHYFFLSREEFERRIAEGDFLEYDGKFKEKGTRYDVDLRCRKRTLYKHHQ